MLIFHKGMLCKEDGDLSMHDLEALGSLKKGLERAKITRKVLDGNNSSTIVAIAAVCCSSIFRLANGYESSDQPV